MTKDKLTEQVLREFRKKDGLKMRLFVDLMIANQGDKKQVREKLDELEGFIHKAYLAGADEMMAKLSAWKNYSKCISQDDFMAGRE